jgi:mono/diheme cytochrome c family protein
MIAFKRLTAAALFSAVFVVSGFHVCGWFTSAQAQDAAPAGDAANGKKIFLADGCFECHGRVGQGGAYNQFVPSLAKTALPFEGFKMQLRNPVSDMPAYTEVVMSDKQVADIYAFLQSLPGRRDVKDFPILNTN